MVRRFQSEVRQRTEAFGDLHSLRGAVLALVLLLQRPVALSEIEWDLGSFDTKDPRSHMLAAVGLEAPGAEADAEAEALVAERQVVYESHMPMDSAQED